MAQEEELLVREAVQLVRLVRPARAVVLPVSEVLVVQRVPVASKVVRQVPVASKVANRANRVGATASSEASVCSHLYEGTTLHRTDSADRLSD